MPNTSQINVQGDSLDCTHMKQWLQVHRYGAREYEETILCGNVIEDVKKPKTAYISVVVLGTSS